MLVAAAVAWWWIFDRYWPRISPSVFLVGEVALVAAALGVAVWKWRRARTLAAGVELCFAAIAALVLCGAVVLGARWRPGA